MVLLIACAYSFGIAMTPDLFVSEIIDMIINIYIICTYSCKWMGMKLCMYDNQSSQRLHTKHSIHYYSF